MAIFQFFLPPGKLIEVFFFSCPPEKFYDIWAQLTKMSSKSEKLLLIKFYDAFVKLESEIFHNFINKKFVVSIFVTNRF